MTAIDTTRSMPSALSRWLGYARSNPATVFCAGLLVVFLLIAIFAPLLAGDPLRIDPAQRLKPPSDSAIWGRDHLGRDVYARAIYGTRVSMLVGFSVAILVTLLGVAIGIYAGLSTIGGAIVMRLADAMMAIPAVLLAIAFASLMNAGLLTVIIAITIPEVPRMVRLVRSVVLGVRQQLHVTAAISIGTSGLPLVWRHILPNTLGPVLVQATYACASAIIASAVLSFLGVGLSPEVPSWGGMMADARQQFRIHPILMLYPGMLLSLLVLAVNILGDRLSDALDPPQGPEVRTVTASPVLSVENLSLEFRNSGQSVYALDKVSFSLARGETLSLVGESGCGKSVTAMAVMGLLPKNSAKVTSGTIRLDGTNLIGLSERQMQSIRGNRIGMVFQDPMTSLNPVHTIGMQIAEAVRRHKRVSKQDAWARARQMLELVRIPDAANRLNAYPHELSGGQRQRVMIAIALACDPELLIADEPTTALDVTVQAQILELIGDLKTELGMSVLLITHDLGVVAANADRMMVMYAGRIVEEGPVERVFARPSHGYTAGLLRSLPGHGSQWRGSLTEIAGTVPRLDRLVEGCVYAPRCAFAASQCISALPLPRQIEAGHRSACIREEAVFAAMADNDIVRSWA